LKSLRTAARGEELEIVEASEAEVPQFLDALYRLHQKRWQERGEAGVLHDEWVQNLHRRVAPEFARAGLLRFYGLKDEGELVSVLYCFAWRDRTYYYLGGFDSEYSRHSPGAQLVYHAIERARAEGCAEFDFLRGAEPYKYRWGAKDRWTYSVRLQALT
jgi:CelD/BcsL family acetyltransferase involved in cellulose biosynthesis